MNSFSQPPLRKAKYIKPNMELKQKVGYGGITPDILRQAQTIIENCTEDFVSMSTPHLAALNEANRMAAAELGNQENEGLIMAMLNPAMQLKGHGGMFGYPSISLLSSRLVQFLEIVQTMDKDVIEVSSSYYTAMNALIVSRVSSDTDNQTKSLYSALNNACTRYFEKNKK